MYALISSAPSHYHDPRPAKILQKHRKTNGDTDYDLTGPEQEGCVRGCAVFFL